MSPSPGPVVVFDIGGVLLDWDPRYLYRKIFVGDDDKMEWFLKTVVTPDWNAAFDAGKPMADGIAELSAKHPDYADEIAAFRKRWPETLDGAIDGTVDILRSLKEGGVELHAITNFSAETFPTARKMFDFLNIFQTITVSGEIGIIKPDRRIFDLFSETSGVAPASAIYIDDMDYNIDAATALGFDAIHFTGPKNLRAALMDRPVGKYL
ncbi:MAG: HAD-IA family hydrolase [Pseudomonadota bacterium]